MDFYSVLGVTRSSTTDEVKRAYKKLAVKYHPDKNLGNAEVEDKFKEVTEAYEVLSDPKKRDLYNRYGAEGIYKEPFFQQRQKMSPEDIFANLFGENFFNSSTGFGGAEQNVRGFFNDAFFGDGFSTGSAHSTPQASHHGTGCAPQGPSFNTKRYGQTPRRGKDVTFALQVELADLYAGRTKHLKITRNVLCSFCRGRGIIRDSPHAPCVGCKGSGAKVVIQQPRPGFIQHLQTMCTDCHGQGFFIREEDKCTQCRGSRIVAEERTLEVVIERGSEEGQVVIFEGLADQLTPDTVPGDVMVILKQKDDPASKWHRRGQDLVYEHTITLLEALTGFEFYLTHLDGRILHVRSESNTIIKPEGDIKVIEKEGMPYRNNPSVKGHLYIELSVEFPDALTSEQQRGLERVLPAKKPLPKLPDNVVVETITATSVDSIRAAAAASISGNNNSNKKKKGEKRKWYQRVADLFESHSNTDKDRK